MKKCKIVFLMGALSLLGTLAHAQIASVRINIPAPPPRVQVARPACPNANYIWREGRWVWDDYMRDYVWYAGYWEYAPPHRCETPPPPPPPSGYPSRQDRGRGNGRWRDRDRH